MNWLYSFLPVVFPSVGVILLMLHCGMNFSCQVPPDN